MAYYLQADSLSLAQLRINFRIDHPGVQATPQRLGRYAKDHGITITDFGAHSVRWVRCFRGEIVSTRTGSHSHRRRAPDHRQLPLFGWGASAVKKVNP